MITGKKVIIAGIAGRVGSGIGEFFLKNGNEVWGYDLFYRPGSRKYWDSKGVHTVMGDFAKGEFDGLPTDADYCINLAANTMPANFSIGLNDNALGPALLMEHCKNVKAFLQFSSCAPYTPTVDPMKAYTEEDAVGSKAEGYYSGTKIAGEGVVKAIARVLNIPTIQLRLSVWYGTHGDGGLFTLVYLSNLVNHLPIEIVKNQPSYFSCIYDKDVNAFMEPLLNAAAVDSPIVNFIGDDCLSVEELVAYMSELTGIKPEYKYVDEPSWPALKIDPEKRKAITGPSTYPWKKGVKETVEYWLPKLQAEQTSTDETATASDAKYSPATRLREISHLPGIVEFLSEKSGQKVPPYALKVGGGITLQKAGGYLKRTDEQIQNVVDELNERYR